MRAWRIALAIAGIGLVGYGLSRIPGSVTPHDLTRLGIWMVAIVVLHDGVLAPTVVFIGWLLRRYVPDRGRRYLQASIIAGALVTAVAIPLILLEGSQPRSKALLQQPYGAHLSWLLVVIGGAGFIAYGLHALRDRKFQRTSTGGNAEPRPASGDGE